MVVGFAKKCRFRSRRLVERPSLLANHEISAPGFGFVLLPNSVKEKENQSTGALLNIHLFALLLPK